MTAKKPTTILAYDHEDREPPAREFRPCSTCRYKFLDKELRVNGCRMFGYMQADRARSSQDLCGRHGDAWRAKEPDDFAAVPMVERVLG